MNEIDREPSVQQLSENNSGAVILNSDGDNMKHLIQQTGGTTCKCHGSDASSPESDSNGSEKAAYVYALGRVEARFPSLGIEKEFAQATGRAETAGLTDRQASHAILTQPQNRYLARQLCYVFTIEGLDTYILQPHDRGDLETFIEAIRPTPRAGDVDAVVGVRGPLAPPEMCNGLTVPMVFVDQIYSFDIDSLVKSIPRTEKDAGKRIPGDRGRNLYEDHANSGQRRRYR